MLTILKDNLVLICIIVLCILGFVSVATDAFFEFPSTSENWYREQFRPEIAGMFLDGILFVGVLGVVQYIAEKSRTHKIKRSLNVPIEKMLADLMVRFVNNESSSFFTAARVHRTTPLNLRDQVTELQFSFNDEEKKKFLEIIKKNKVRLEAVLPATAQVSDKYILQYLTILDLMDGLLKGTSEANKSTIIHILDSVNDMGGSYNKNYITYSRLDKASLG